MKISKKLTIAGNEYRIAQDTVRLSIYAPGVAEFVIEAPQPVKGLAVFWLGNTLTENPDAPATLQQFFMGYVARSVTAGPNKQSVLVRELVNVLEAPLPLSLRHVNARDVLGHISAETGLAFEMPAEAYSARRVAYFYNMASGFHALDSIGKVFAIPDYIWQQNGDGSVYAGSHAHSHWVTCPVELPHGFFSGATSSNRYTCAAIPSMRPGAVMNSMRVVDVLLTGNTMTLTCEG